MAPWATSGAVVAFGAMFATVSSGPMDRPGWWPAERIEGDWGLAGIALECPEDGAAVLTGIGPRLTMPAE